MLKFISGQQLFDYFFIKEKIIAVDEKNTLKRCLRINIFSSKIYKQFHFLTIGSTSSKNGQVFIVLCEFGRRFCPVKRNR